jgi:hypothetical protein
VQVIVADGRVSRVVVIDEGCSPDRETHTACADCYQMLPAIHPAVVGAYDIAEREEWPSWEHGF